MYYNRNLIGADKSAVTPKDASGIFDLRSQEKHQRNQDWPGSVAPYLTYTINYSGTPFEVRQIGTRSISINWGDGSSELSNAESVTHTYSSNGIYEIKIDTHGTNTYYRPNFLSTSSDSRNQLIKMKIGRYLRGNLDSCFRSCENLEEIIAPYYSFSSVTTFRRTFRDLHSLKVFPFIETRGIGNFENFCWGQNQLTTFPKLDFRAATKFNSAWRNCQSLAHFPPNMFDITSGHGGADSFDGAWNNCALTAQSIENILTSLDTNGSTNVNLGITGGTNAGASTWSTAATTAYNNLITKGWNISRNS
mgnify:CR=1 FL=1